MTCHKAGELLSAYIEGELAARQSAALDTHLTGCDGCREELETLRNVVAMLEAPKSFARPEGLLEEFKEKYLPAAEAEAEPRWGFRLPSLPQFEWPTMGRVLLPMGGMAAAAAALMVALQMQPMPEAGRPTVSSGYEQVATSTGTTATNALVDADAAKRVAVESKPKAQPTVKAASPAPGRSDSAGTPALAAPQAEPKRPAEKATPLTPRGSRRPRMIVASGETPGLELRARRSRRPMPLRAGQRYADAALAQAAVDEKAAAALGKRFVEPTPTPEDEWKNVAAVTLRTSAVAAESSEAGYAEVSSRNVKTGEVKSAAFGAPVAATMPTVPALRAPAGAAAPVETDETE